MIKLLDQQLIEKIAAGEVIERPSSVIKELLENALDAKATSIIVRIEEGGKRRMTITDNGLGITEDELPLAVQRHATSKISKLDDLYALDSLGFRGEALAAMDAAGVLTITSKPETQQNAAMIKQGTVMPAAHVDGTTVELAQLFDAIPARKKFLKSATAETRAIATIIKNYSLCYPKVSFTLFADGKKMFSYKAAQSLVERSADVLETVDKKTLAALEKTTSPDDVVSVGGVIALPPTYKSSRNAQFFFCNNRYIQSPALSKALQQAYRGYLGMHDFPVGVIHLQVKPSQIDVNVHPAKTTIKFSDEQTVFRAVYYAVKKTLDNAAKIQEPTEEQLNFASQSTNSELFEKNTSDLHQPIVNEAKNSFREHTLTTSQQVQLKESEAGYNATTPAKTNTTAFADTTGIQPTSEDEVPPFRILTIISKTFVVSEHQEGLCLTDFHAAYERLNYEVFKKQYEQKKISVQKLLEPLVVNVDELKKTELLEATDILNNMGIVLEDFGPGAIQIAQVPMILGKKVDVQSIKELLLDDSIKGVQLKQEKRIDHMLATMACKASPRAGDTIEFPQAKQLIIDLYHNQLTWTCPHGRPVMLLLSPEKIASIFKR